MPAVLWSIEEDSEFHEDNFARTEHPSSSSKDRGRQTEALILEDAPSCTSHGF